MLDVVKFTWRNKHGYWIPVAWTIVGSWDHGTEGLKRTARLGRPGMTDIKELDRATIPEELRMTGRVRYCLSQTVLYDPNEASYSAQEMLEAMLVQTA